MPVEGDVFELQLLFVAVLVDERGLELAFASRAEPLDLDLLREVDMVLGHFLENGLLCAPVYGQLLVLLLPVVLEVVDLVLGEGFLLHGGEVAVQGLDIDAHLVVLVQDNGDVLVGMGDADVYCRSILVFCYESSSKCSGNLRLTGNLLCQR